MLLQQGSHPCVCGRCCHPRDYRHDHLKDGKYGSVKGDSNGSGDNNNNRGGNDDVGADGGRW
jgi:hypothetical protein